MLNISQKARWYIYVYVGIYMLHFLFCLCIVLVASCFQKEDDIFSMYSQGSHVSVILKTVLHIFNCSSYRVILVLFWIVFQVGLMMVCLFLFHYCMQLWKHLIVLLKAKWLFWPFWIQLWKILKWLKGIVYCTSICIFIHVYLVYVTLCMFLYTNYSSLMYRNYSRHCNSSFCCLNCACVN